MARLTLFRRGQVVQSLLRDEDVVRIGRLPSLEVVLDAPTVSREHAVLRRFGPGWVVEDRGSVNGIRLNGKAVKRHPVEPGDRIQIEEFELLFEPPEDTFLAGLDPTLRAAARRLEGSDPNLTFLNVRRLLGD
jgi:pSer/pThr/pTyr-binding forkhead associated (FHA) protein